MKKWIISIITAMLIIPIVYPLIECEGVMNTGDLPCLIISTWQFPSGCNSYTIQIYQANTTLLDTIQMANYGDTGRCNITFNYTALGSYLMNWSSGDSSKIIIEEDNDMLIALVIGISIIVGLFIYLTFAVKDDKPFLAHFFFLGIFIFTTVLSNLIWKITNVNQAPYEPIMLVVYRILLIITFTMFLIVLIMLTVEVVKIRRIAGNPIDNYRDNLGKNE